VAAAELEELGFQALWIPDVGGQVFDAVDHLLAQLGLIGCVPASRWRTTRTTCCVRASPPTTSRR
jgi:hypothetical protein